MAAQQQQSESVFTIEQGNRISISGVESVESFSDGVIVLTAGGKRVHIRGNGLKILTFAKGSGAFAATGEVADVRFSAGKKLSSLFK